MCDCGILLAYWVLLILVIGCGGLVFLLRVCVEGSTGRGLFIWFVYMFCLTGGCVGEGV